MSQHQNGPVGEETDDGGTVEGKGDQVLKEFHEEVVRGKEEELAKVKEENDELKEELKQTRAKLDDLKTKNDVSSMFYYSTCIDMHCVCECTCIYILCRV